MSQCNTLLHLKKPIRRYPEDVNDDCSQCVVVIGDEVKPSRKWPLQGTCKPAQETGTILIIQIVDVDYCVSSQPTLQHQKRRDRRQRLTADDYVAA